MTRIAPLKALIYNQDKIQNLAKVVCPPYDIISPVRQEYYHNNSPYNLTHIILAKDTPSEDKYVKAGNTFRQWQKEGALVPDAKPAIYFYNQQYNIDGEKRSRMGFIARLYLEDKCCAVFGHEHTQGEPKEDRLRLLRQVEANLSPIFALFKDKKRIIRRIYQQYLQDKKPFIHISDDEKVEHKLWRIDSQEILNSIESSMKDENIFIADGHHRFEVACAYREEMKNKLGVLTGEEGFNYLLAYFTSTDERGLTVLPIHRLVNTGEGFQINGFVSRLTEYFDLDEIKDKARFSFLLKKAGYAQHVIGMYKSGKYWLLRLKNIKMLDRLINDRSKEYRTLDVAILNYIILNKILGLNSDGRQNVDFIQDAEELIIKIDSGTSAVGFFLNPVKIEHIMSVALTGEKMPPKSTYFYPKVLSGLVINKFSEGKS